MLKPSMREKWRYVAFRLEMDSEISEADAKEGTAGRGALSESGAKTGTEGGSAGALRESEAKEGIEKGIIRFLGELGASIAKPKVIDYDAQKREGIVRCETAGVGEVRAALALINNLGGRKCAVRTLKTSGTVRALREKAGL